MATTSPEALRFETPALEHVLTVHASIGTALPMGRTPQGQRRVIPVSGGTSYQTFLHTRHLLDQLMRSSESASSRSASRLDLTMV
jgi:hypothetical protein